MLGRPCTGWKGGYVTGLSVRLKQHLGQDPVPVSKFSKEKIT